MATATVTKVTREEQHKATGILENTDEHESTMDEETSDELPKERKPLRIIQVLR